MDFFNENVFPEINIKRKIFDPERQRTTLEIEIGKPYETIVSKTGSLGRIAFQLVEQFALPLTPKELAEKLTEQWNLIELEIPKEARLYQEFHSWLTEKEETLVSKQEIWFERKNEHLRIRMTTDACKMFFQSRNIVSEKEREDVLRYWREKGWLMAKKPRLNKMIKIKTRDRDKFLLVYEVILSENFLTDDIINVTGEHPSFQGEHQVNI